MTPDGFALAATIILLFSMLYFQMTSPTFLLVKLEIPTVTRLMRGHFSGYFLALSLQLALVFQFHGGLFLFELALLFKQVQLRLPALIESLLLFENLFLKGGVL